MSPLERYEFPPQILDKDYANIDVHVLDQHVDKVLERIAYDDDHEGVLSEERKSFYEGVTCINYKDVGMGKLYGISRLVRAGIAVDCLVSKTYEHGAQLESYRFSEEGEILHRILPASASAMPVGLLFPQVVARNAKKLFQMIEEHHQSIQVLDWSTQDKNGKTYYLREALKPRKKSNDDDDDSNPF